MNIQIQILKPDIINIHNIPKYETNAAAALDLRVAIDNKINIKPNECKLLPTGIAINIIKCNIAGIIIPRSGLGHNQGLILGNSLGLIDADYQGEIMLSCWNRSNKINCIQPLTRIAQIMFINILKAKFTIVQKFKNKSTRYNKGFGHTGLK